MALKDLIPTGREIETPAGKLTVYPITLEELMGLLGQYKKELTALLNGETSIADLFTDAPVLVARMIALGTHEPDAVEDVRKLAFGTQLAALEAIWTMSVPDEETLGKVLGLLLSMARATRKSMSARTGTQPSPVLS